MREGAKTSRPTTRLAVGCWGAALVLGFFSLSSVTDGMRVVFRLPWDRLAPEEAWYWLGSFFLLLPGSALLGWATGPVWTAAWRWLSTRLEVLSTREQVLLSLTVAVLGASLAQLANALVLHGLPVTDDEYGALFGGQVWAAGHLHAPLPPWMPAAPQLFLFSREGWLTSFDFPGVLGAWALSTLSGTGTWLFSLLAGASLAGLAVAAARRWGTRVGAVAVALALASPHFALISMSSHAHVLSRGFLAASCGVLLFVEAPGARRGLAGGLLLGLGGLARPIEVALVAGPWALGLLIDAVRARRFGFVAGFLGGALAMVLLFFALNWGSGHSLLPLRFLPNDIVHPYGGLFRPPFSLAAWPERFGNNVMYNLLMSGVFLLGPLGLPLAAIGARVDATHRRLAVGAAAAFALGLLHDDRGIHALGPVHVTEASVVLLLLALAGSREVFRWLSRVGLPTPEGAWLGYLLGLTVFTGGYVLALGRQATTQRDLYAQVESGQAVPTVILAPRYPGVRSAADASQVGSWVYSWRRVTPSASEQVVILHDSPEARRGVRSWFPQRAVRVLQSGPTGWQVVPLEEAAPPKAGTTWVELRNGEPRQ